MSGMHRSNTAANPPNHGNTTPDSYPKRKPRNTTLFISTDSPPASSFGAGDNQAGRGGSPLARGGGGGAGGPATNESPAAELSVGGEEPAEILPYLFLGDETHAMSTALLDKLGVTAIFNVSADCERKRFEPRYQYKEILIRDHLDEDILKYFPIAVEYIDEVERKGGKVLVHCTAGKSRSPTIVLAYLIWKKKWSLTQATEFVNAKRLIQPNLGFLLVLTEYERSTLGTDSRSGLYQLSKGASSTLPNIVVLSNNPSEIQSALPLITRYSQRNEIVSTIDDALDKIKRSEFKVLLFSSKEKTPGLAQVPERIRELTELGQLTFHPVVVVIVESAEEKMRWHGVDDFLEEPITARQIETIVNRQMPSLQRRNTY